MKVRNKKALCIVIAGPSGAGKTTFAREYLLKDARVIHFVNADLIAGGLSPLRPELAALTAGRLFLRHATWFAALGEDGLISLSCTDCSRTVGRYMTIQGWLLS